ncbi:hypothetical protein MA16_Dca023156 [Dendrobium catenatum]|uniref:Uncharacterized protein n=1 Tax=Dendrobium catenatum TaxID=906689 RepID=A0A2I0V6Z3_9ASPA|nr:hypothetical protein MA16_Dca023156 [Dendrobium catenatum]
MPRSRRFGVVRITSLQTRRKSCDSSSILLPCRSLNTDSEGSFDCSHFLCPTPRFISHDRTFVATSALCFTTQTSDRNPSPDLKS